MNRLFNKALFLVLALAIFPFLAGISGCAQDSIFSYISHEEAPTEPLILGSPSKIIKAGDKLYVTNGKIYELAIAGDVKWKKSADNPDGYVWDVAATSGGAGDTLYALIITGAGIKTTVWKKDLSGNSNWEPVSIEYTNGYNFIQTIHGAGDILFAGAARSSDDGKNDYAVFFEDGGPLKLLTGTDKIAGVLSGAGKIGTEYYFGTLGGGIWQLDSPSSASPVSVSVPPIPARITGFGLQVTSSGEQFLIGASRNGDIICRSASDSQFKVYSLGGTFTGALALWEDKSTPPQTLLLIGIKGGSTSYNHGYREVLFDRSTGTVVGSMKSPGEGTPSSISDNKKYTSTLGRYPVNTLWVLPPAPESTSPPIMFASTQKVGLYSYRYRSSGGWHWNAEEENP